MLEELYTHLIDNPDKVPNLYFPSTSVYFVKRKLDEHFGRVFRYSLVRRLMKEEGMLEIKIPQWYSDKWFK